MTLKWPELQIFPVQNHPCFLIYLKAYTTDSESVIPKSDFSPALSVSRRIVLEPSERIAPPTPQRPRIPPLIRTQRKTPPPIPPRLNELKPVKTPQVSFSIHHSKYSMDKSLLIDMFRVWLQHQK